MFLHLLQNRRSIRKFQEKPVEKEKIDQLVECMLRSPSSRGLNPWEFVVVDNKETLAALSQAKPHGASFIKNAPLAIAVCAHPSACDVWVEDCSIASTLIHLAATDLGLGSCWVQLRLREHAGGESASKHAAHILGFSEDVEVEAVIAIGYPGEQKSGHSKESLLWDRVHFNRYSPKR
jgi:nitroreductase